MRPSKERKGQIQIGNVPTLVVTLGVLALVIAVLALVLADFRDSQASCPTGFTYNADNEWCYNTTNSSNANTTPTDYVWNMTSDGLTAVDNVSNQMGTVGTVIIAAVLLGLIVTAFVMFRRP